MTNTATWAVYGGRFDPFHNAHLAVVHQALAQLPVTRLLVVPNGAPVHQEVVAPWAQRYRMCELAVEDCPGAAVSGLESPAQPRPAIATATALAQQVATQIWVVGGDSFATLASWQEWQDLFGRVNWAVMPRPDLRAATPHDDHAAQLVAAGTVATAAQLAAGAGKVWYWPQPVGPHAASSLQAMIAAAQPGWEQLVPPAVAHHITEQELYLLKDE